MKRQLAHAVLLVAAAGIGFAAAGPGAVEKVALAVETPSVEVRPRPPGRQLLDLPALEYSFEVDARCKEQWVPESLSLSIADSRVVLGASQLSAGEPRRVSLKIPARQLAPVVIHDFCIVEDAVATPGLKVDRLPTSVSQPGITIKSVLSAQASLLCRKDEERSIVYVSKPLDVTLICLAPAAPSPAD